MKEPNDIDPIENEEENEPNDGPDPAVQEIIETLPAYKDWQRERMSEREGLTFGDW
jgi:hypothetical protein